MDGMEILKVVDTNGRDTLYRFPENDVFPEFSILDENGYISVISDMQGPQPESLEDVADFDWYPAEMLGMY